MFNGVSEFYNGVTSSSLRLDRGSAAYLSRTPAGAGNRKVFTLSFWVKRSKISVADTALFGVQVDGNNRVYARWEADDTFKWYFAIGGTGYDSGTLIKFRDTSSWYHIVVAVNMAGSGDAGKLKIYVNGVNQIVTYASTLPDADTAMNTANVHLLGKKDGAGNYMDGYLAEVNFVDGTMLTPATFGETKNGVWIPKAPSPTYGTNGYRLQFTSIVHDAPEDEGTEDTDNIGADTSGEHNNWTAVDAIVASDCAIPDCPENNFPTMNPIDVGTGGGTIGLINYSEGNLKVFASGGAMEGTRSSIALPQSGKWYWEVGVVALGYINQVGISTSEKHVDNTADGQADHIAWGFGTWMTDNNSGNSKYQVNVGGSGGDNWVAQPASGDVLGIAYDADNGKLWFARNGTYQNTSGTANPATGADPRASSLTGKEWFPLFAGYPDGSPNYIMNFGQDSSFAGNETAQGNTDGNGIGDFYYAPPSGYLTLCAVNLPETTIGPNSATQSDDYFNIVLWTGNGQSGQAISGVGFKPDWVWIKELNSTSAHNIYDSSRGVKNNLEANGSGAETDYDSNLLSFDKQSQMLGLV